MFVIAAQICVIYATAGLFRVQGLDVAERNGAVDTLHLDYMRPFPALSSLLSSARWPYSLSYMTVLVQTAFPFCVFHRKLKNCLVVALMAGTSASRSSWDCASFRPR